LQLTPDVIRRLVREGVLVRLRRGVLVGGCVLERSRSDERGAHLLATRAQLAAFPDCVATHESAAITLGVPLLTVPALPRITRVRGAWRGGDAVRVRIAPLPPAHIVQHAGLRVTTLPRTAVDLARTLPFRDAVVALDAIRRSCDRRVLLDMLDECRPWADLGKAHAAVTFADPRAESAFEPGRTAPTSSGRSRASSVKQTAR
jgi:hypothetical protein